MPTPTHITVTAPPGRVTPVDRRDGAEPGGGQLRVIDGVVVRVRFAGSGAIRRSIARGDLIPCDMNGAPVASAELAAAPTELPEGRVLVKRDAKSGKATP